MICCNNINCFDNFCYNCIQQTTTCDDVVCNEIESQNSVISESSVKKQTENHFLGCISTEFIDNEPG